MNKSRVVLVALNSDDREQFIKDNQWAFKYGSMEEDGEIISRKTIEDSV